MGFIQFLSVSLQPQPHSLTPIPTCISVFYFSEIIKNYSLMFFGNKAIVHILYIYVNTFCTQMFSYLHIMHKEIFDKKWRCNLFAPRNLATLFFQAVYCLHSRICALCDKNLKFCQMFLQVTISEKRLRPGRDKSSKWRIFFQYGRQMVPNFFRIFMETKVQVVVKVWNMTYMFSFFFFFFFF